MSLPKEYKDRIKLFFRRFLHNLSTISHRQAVAEEYVKRNTKSGVLSKDVASVPLQLVDEKGGVACIEV
jgi:hypothetical protein